MLLNKVMTLQEIKKRIIGAALSMPTIRRVILDDIFRINECRDITYAVFGLMENSHTIPIDGSFRTFSFTFFYVDRLTDCRSNQGEIKSEAVEALENIVMLVVSEELGITASSMFVTTFNQKFNDECAGAYCTISFNVPKASTCPDIDDPVDPEILGSFSKDFSKDFK